MNNGVSTCCRHTNERPFAVSNVVGDVNAVHICKEMQVELETIIHPRGEFEAAKLIIEWKPRDVDGTG